MQLALFALALAAPLQSTAPELSEVIEFTISDPGRRHAKVHHDVDAEGVHWLRGRNYKASASSSGFAFHPFLGSGAPRNFPVGFRLRSGERDDVQLSVDREAKVARTGDRITIDRGDVEVRYDAEVDQVEQSFALDIPAGSGPLVLTLDVETELRVTDEAGGFRFVHELGGMTYSAAVAIDAGGRRVHVPASWNDGQVRLSVPADFLEDAESPLVIDPILATYPLNPPTVSVGAPDLAYGDTNRIFSAVYEERFSATDVDVFMTFLTANGSLVFGAYVDMTATSWRRPRLAQVAFSLRTLIVAEAPSPAVPGSTDVVARLRETNGNFAPPFVLRGGTATYSCSAPIVGGDYWAGGSSFCVAYNRDFGSRREVHAVWTNAIPGQTEYDQPMATSPTEDASEPTISRAMDLISNESRWLIAWPTRDLATGASSIQSKSISFAGFNQSGPYTVAPPTTLAQYDDVYMSDRTDFFNEAGFPHFYAVAYDDRTSTESDAFVALSDGTSVHDTIELQVAEHADRTFNRENVVIATGPGHFMLGYLEEGNAFVTTLQPTSDSLGIIERRLPLGGPGIVNGSLVARGRLAESSFTIQGRSMFAWTLAFGAFTEIRGAYVTLPDDRNAGGKQYCYGEPNSTGERGFLHCLGNRIPGLDHELRVESLPPNSAGFFLASLTPDYAPGVGGSQGALCVGGNIGRFGVFQASTEGTASVRVLTSAIAQPTGPVASMSNDLWHFQCWHRDGVGGVATSNFTNGTTIRFR